MQTFLFAWKRTVCRHENAQQQLTGFEQIMQHFSFAIVAFQLTVHLLENHRLIPYWNLLFFYRILNSEIISSTILFNNGSKFQNLSDPVVINLSSVTEVRTILSYLPPMFHPYFLNLQYIIP